MRVTQGIVLFESPALLFRVGEFLITVGQLQAAVINLEAAGDGGAFVIEFTPQSWLTVDYSKS